MVGAKCLKLGREKLINHFNCLSTIDIKTENISNIILTWNQYKAHGNDDIPVRMIKICGSSIMKPLQLLFNNCVKQWVFPNGWKMANVLPMHNTIKSKQLVDHHKFVWLLPNC